MLDLVHCNPLEDIPHVTGYTSKSRFNNWGRRILQRSKEGGKISSASFQHWTSLCYTISVSDQEHVNRHWNNPD